VSVEGAVNCVAYCTPLSQIVELDVKPVPVTVTVALPTGSGFGETEVMMGGGGRMVTNTLAEYLLPVVAVAPAVIVWVLCAGTAAGAVYNPPASPVEIVPVAALPPWMEATSHLREAMVNPLGVAVNCSVPPTGTVG
jgi:hypothetical protein